MIPLLTSSIETLKTTIVQLLSEKKAEDIVVIDISDKTILAKYMILSNGSSSRNITAIANHVSFELKKNSNVKIKISGFGNAKWIVLDIGDIIVHILNSEMRQYYQLETLWS